MVYVYCPREDAVFSYALNSQPGAEQNQSGKLAVSLYIGKCSGGSLEMVPDVRHVVLAAIARVASRPEVDRASS